MGYKVEKRKNGRLRMKFFTVGESMTKQSFKDQCDINKILHSYRKYGKLPDMIKQNMHFGDFSEVPDYKESLDIVIRAQTQFNSLDSALRKRFHNDPVEFLEFVHDSNNKDELIKMGVIKGEIADKPVTVPEKVSSEIDKNPPAPPADK